MAIVDFVVGAALAFAFWGGRPPGMFQPEMVSATYFLLAKVGIGVVLGVFYGVVYGVLNPSLPGKGVLNGLFFGFLLFMIIRGHELSFTVFFAPTKATKPDILVESFWAIHMFCRMIAYGAVLGYIYPRLAKRGGVH